ncbi:hypothetical protein KI387_001549 [Taxus chinensis]|uniref:Protein DEFECTIVE KERNEL 1 n=1 Tax=Taxus chinensis TaxID=29808 RepID=A0AA38GW46_TAXCH|nr:hypothetical protein KI387_001549 [Taxus chinensis]
MEGEGDLVVASAVCATLFALLGAFSLVILCRVNWRPWRIYSWVFARKWPTFLQGPQLCAISGLLSLLSWAVVISPLVVVIVWGSWLMAILDRDIIGLAIIMAGTALLLSFYAIMLWWRTQWQSSRAVEVLLYVAVALLCAYELLAVYVTAGGNSYSASGLFFGVSAQALAINMLFICRMVFHGAGLDVDEYVRGSYKFAYADGIEVGPVACLPEPPDPNNPSIRKPNRTFHSGCLYFGSLIVLLVYSILYGLTAKEVCWLGVVTSVTIVVLDIYVGACLFGFELLKSRVTALFVAGTYRSLFICFGVHYWYLGHCISYAVVASALSGAAVTRRFSVVSPLAARRDALESTVIRLREGFRRKETCGSSSFSEGCESSAKRSSSVEAAQIGTPIEAYCRSKVQGQGDGGATSNSMTHPGAEDVQEGEHSAKSLDSGRPSLGLQNTSASPSSGLEFDGGTASVNQQLDGHCSERNKHLAVGPSSQTDSQGSDSCTSGGSSVNQQNLDLNLAMVFQERLNDPRISSMLKLKARQGDHELTSLLQDKGLDPNFAVMLKEKGLDPTILALLQRSSLDADRDHRDNTEGAGLESNQTENIILNQVSWSEELRERGFEKWIQAIRFLVRLLAGTAEKAWALVTVFFIAETVAVGILHPKTVNVINRTHQQFQFGLAALLFPPVFCSIMAFIRSLQAEEMAMTSKPRKYCFIAWLVSTCAGLILSVLSKSSILLGLALTVPLMLACLSVAIPIWINNGYRFCTPAIDRTSDSQGCFNRSKEVVAMAISVTIFITSVMALGALISVKPLDDLGYHGWNSDQENFTSPYTSSFYLGWAIASVFALVITGVLPAVSWFATYRFSLSSAICVGIFIIVLVTFCGVSYLGVVQSREGQVPMKEDFLAALLPLVCIPAVLSLCCGMYKWKDDSWHLSRGVYMFVGMGVFLLLGAISAVIATINPWMVGVTFLLLLLLLVLAIGVIHHWASNNFYLTRSKMFLVCLALFVLALAAFLVGLLADEPFVGASVGYFSVLFLLAGRALTVLLSPPVVVYSPRVLPVYVYDAHADSAKNVSAALLVLFGIALATMGWGVVASLEIYPPFAGAAVSAITLVVAYGFAVSRPCLTMKMMEDAVDFLCKETVVQAIARSSTKARNALSGTYSAPQRSASSAALLVGDPAASRDRAGNFVLPRADVMKLRERLSNEEAAAGVLFCRPNLSLTYRRESSSEVGYRRKMCAHARILALEEAIDTEWVYMWDKFGGYLLLLLGLAAKAERVQDEVRLRLFLDSIGFSDLSAKKIKKWLPEDHRRFEIIQESYIREKEMEEELLMQRREEEGKGKERRKALLEREERKWKEIEASFISSIPNAGSKEAAAMAAAVRAVGGDALLDDAGAREQVSSIARRILTAQMAHRAEQTGVHGAVCILGDEPRTGGRHCGYVDPNICRRQKITFSASVMIQPESGPVCLLGTESQQRVCWEILVAGSEQGIEAGQVGLRLVTKGERQTTVAKGWNIGASSIADGRWHTVTVTIDAETGEATTYLDGGFDSYQNRLPLWADDGILQEGAEVWVGMKPPLDLDAFGRSDSEGAESKMHIMDVFLWGRCLTEDEITTVYTATNADEYNMVDPPDDYWRCGESPRVEEWDSEPADVDFYDRDDVEWDGQFSSGRKRRAEREGVALDMDYIARRLRKPKMETQEEINQRMRSVESAVKEDLAARGETHFTDQDFPPSRQSLFVDPENPTAKLQVVSEWMRPSELVKEISRDLYPCLFMGAPNASDVCQGRLGDCWFLSAVAVLTEASRMANLIITPQYNEEGVYTVRFCIQGEWVPVVVDDWIPCESRGKPAFATSRKVNELWVSILEKAYAKLHGSYEALEGGFVQDALVDLTGGAGEEIDMRSAQAQIELASGKLWSQLLHFKQEGFLLGAGSPSGSDVHVSSSGIVQGHAYSLLQVREVDGHKMVQIRNPWANEVEWNGPWSDSSPEWTDRIKHKLKFTPQAQDGIFWMSWQDFQLHFRSIYVCRVYPPEMRYSVHGQWRGLSAGGCQWYDTWHQNPQFRLKAVGPDANSDIHVFVTLTQGVNFSSRKKAGFGNYQSSHDTSMFHIGMRILKTRGKRAHNIYLNDVVGSTDYVNSREIAWECDLEPDPKGYTIVPTTIHPGEEAPFVLSVFTKASIVLEPI